MSSLLQCNGCEARYDVGGREPGQRVRCPRCRAVLVVPERSPGEDVTASQRLRRAQGPVCRRHPRVRASRRCEECGERVCARCAAPDPLDHLCASCAREAGLGGAIPLDFGFLAVWARAAAVFGRTFPRLVAWNILASLSAAGLCAIPGLVGAFILDGAGGLPALQTNATAQLGGSLVVGALVLYWVSVNFLLLPAGCALFVDQELRRSPLPFGVAFARTVRRVARNAGALFAVFLVYVLLTLLLLLPGLVLFFASALSVGPSSPLPIGLLASELGLGLLFVAAGLGLAVPVVVLEERGAFQALGRAWQLAAPRFWELCVLFASYALLYALATALASALARATLPLLGLLLSGVLDLFWPALLVTAYHGLAAEDAGVLGRGRA